MSKPTTPYGSPPKPATNFETPSFDLSALATEAGEGLLTEDSISLVVDAPEKSLTPYGTVSKPTTPMAAA